MTLRITEIRRVLKPHGSFYLHCDPTASHYLKLVLDGIFCSQGGDFLNEIIWCYSIGGKSKNAFGRKHDVLLVYTKSSDGSHTFNEEGARIPRKPDSHMKVGLSPDGREFQEKTDRKSGKVYRYYLDEGKIAEDYWTDIETLNRDDAERLGYPTQKPSPLLTRIVNTSSNPGDVVLDAYCGCGTTIAVAERLNRRWVGIDITFQSISLVLKRLEDTFGEAVTRAMILDGVPSDMDSATALAHKKDDRVRKEFEKWAVLTYTRNRGVINEKKGADAGIDGTVYFLKSPEENGTMVFQVKSGGVSRGDIAKLRGDMQRAGAEMATLITLEEPTAPMKAEAKQAGTYLHALMGRTYDKIQIVTVRQIIEEHRCLDLPLGKDVLKAAEPQEDAETLALPFAPPAVKKAKSTPPEKRAKKTGGA